MTEYERKKQRWTKDDRQRLNELLHEPVLIKAMELVALENTPSAGKTATLSSRPAQDILTLSSSQYFLSAGIQTFKDGLLDLASEPPQRRESADDVPMAHIKGNDVQGEDPYTVN